MSINKIDGLQAYLQSAHNVEQDDDDKFDNLTLFESFPEGLEGLINKLIHSEITELAELTGGISKLYGTITTTSKPNSIDREIMIKITKDDPNDVLTKWYKNEQ